MVFLSHFRQMEYKVVRSKRKASACEQDALAEVLKRMRAEHGTLNIQVILKAAILID